MDKSEAPTIMVVGDIMLDSYITVSQVDKKSDEYPYTFECNPMVSDEYTFSLGGAANVACNLATLGANVILIGTAGNDSYGEQLKLLLDQNDITHDLITGDEFVTTVKQRIRIKKSSCNLIKNFRIDIEKRDACAPDPTILSKIFSHIEKGIDAVILSDYGKGMFCHTKLSKQIISYMVEDKGIPVLIDPKQYDVSKYAGATLIKPNEIELENMIDIIFSQTNHDEIYKKCNETIIEKHKIKNILITRNENGCVFINDTSVEEIKPRADNAIDPNGAGDTVLAIIAVGISSGLQMSSAARLANCAASIVVNKSGTNTVSPTELHAMNANCDRHCEYWTEHNLFISNISAYA